MERNRTAGKTERIIVRLVSSWLFSLTLIAVINGGDIKAKDFGLALIPEGLAVAGCHHQ